MPTEQTTGHFPPKFTNKPCVTDDQHLNSYMIWCVCVCVCVGVCVCVCVCGCVCGGGGGGGLFVYVCGGGGKMVVSTVPVSLQLHCWPALQKPDMCLVLLPLQQLRPAPSQKPATQRQHSHQFSPCFVDA